MNNLFDLRFVIGVFFLVIGLLLTVYGFAVYGQSHSELNIVCGISFLLFSIVMILLSRKKPSGTPKVEEEISS